MRQQSNILNPNNGHIEIFTETLMPNIRFLHDRIVTAKQSFLYLPQRRTSLHEINSFDTRCETLKVAERLSQNRINISHCSFIFKTNPKREYAYP